MAQTRAIGNVPADSDSTNSFTLLFTTTMPDGGILCDMQRAFEINSVFFQVLEQHHAFRH